MIENEEEARVFVAARCDARSLIRLERFVEYLGDENERQNLIAAATLPIIWQRHIADSAQLLDHVSRETSGSWLDLGTGAGFPGLIIAVMQSQREVILVESRARRIEWLLRLIEHLDLANCRVEGRRLETVAPFPAAVISARAFAPLPKLVDLARRFSTRDTIWLLPKGRSAAQEIWKLPERTRSVFHVEQSQTDPDAGIVVGTGLEANAP